eukprot:7390689-Prymnesium_polylepis.3
MGLRTWAAADGRSDSNGGTSPPTAAARPARTWRVGSRASASTPAPSDVYGNGMAYVCSGVARAW